MSQRTQHVNEEIIVELKFKVTINSFSNHDGFKEGQIEQAIQEFKDNIQKELEYKINGEYSQQEFLETVDFVSYKTDVMRSACKCTCKNSLQYENCDKLCERWEAEQADA